MSRQTLGQGISGGFWLGVVGKEHKEEGGQRQEGTTRTSARTVIFGVSVTGGPLCCTGDQSVPECNIEERELSRVRMQRREEDDHDGAARHCLICIQTSNGGAVASIGVVSNPK